MSARGVVLAALAGVLMAGPALALDFDVEAVEARCAGEWPDDAAMQTRCVANHRAGYEAIAAFLDDEDDVAMVAALEDCAAEWREDWTMAGYCAQEQIAGRVTLEETLAELPEDVGAEILERCDSHWEDFRMRAHCVARDAADWHDTNGQGEDQ